VPYREERHLQGIHVLAARRAGGARTVPVLVTPAGEVLAESSAIVRWALPELYAEADAARLEARLDAGFGPDGRLWMYHHTLPAVRALAPWALAGVPPWERAAFAVGGRLVEPGLRRYLGVDAAAAAGALARVDAMFAEVADRLADGRPYLLGERFSAADLAFAALAAPVLVPPRYGSPLPPVEALPAEMAREVRRLREHPAGRFALRLYETER
jgi:glutathione S-transferase